MSGSLAYGRVDREGRLVEAELPLQRLQESAGSGLGQPVAVPQIATMARLAQRLGILVSRCVIAAEGSDDLDLWVEAKPDDDGVALSVGGWSRRPSRAGDESGERVYDFMRSRGDWLWETDPSLKITSVGAEGADALVGQPFGRMFQFVDTGEGLPILEALATRARFEGQEAVVRSSGERVRLTGLPLMDGGGRFAGYRGSAFRLDGEPAPAEAQEPVADAFGARLEKALRGPLSQIISQAENIGAQKDGPIRRDYAEYANDIASAGRHLLGVIGDLVDLQAIEREDFRLRAERIDISDLARRAAGLLKVRASERGIRIDMPAVDETLWAAGDEGRIVQILVNLIGNAVRHSPENASVWLRAEAQDGRAVLVVADQGPGIAPGDHQRIFEKFTRIAPSDGVGSGLGLYIARRLARAMGGDIAVDSAPGQGARFMLSLPLA
ncbi:putative two-component histidine kinase [Sphingomonas changbaiensis NBRC 104936]|uniref:histidine kinase n=1 Tax=Sphingomonas changbaiensis NBRC 104936 TaxID=1219043 RepID=A0A0E9MJU2_9SPHN|nr:HAMP domain-containing sensor histidine kinase [Sphingomonas changbaiensis]GAO38062.1 putative two-component histidine kinase [Sphingomonas changbaiensis NBRC 104936]